MIVVFDRSVLMLMGRFLVAMCMSMRVHVRMLVGMGQVTMAVLMGVYMGMLVGVLKRNGIFDHQYRRGDHDGKAKVKLHTGALTQ